MADNCGVSQRGYEPGEGWRAVAGVPFPVTGVEGWGDQLSGLVSDAKPASKL
jgi:hypothetical protein